jgi:MFS transporter, NNP family, nitrate/nitrite transporter
MGDALNLRHARKFLSEDLKLGPLLYLTSIFWINFIARVILSPLMPAIEKDLGLSHTDAGTLFLFISIGYFVGIFGSGFVASKVTYRKTIISSAVIVAIAMIGIGCSPGIRTIRLGLLTMGIGSGLYLPSGIATITTLVETRHWGKALAIHELAPNLGFISAPLICVALVSSISWRGVLIVIGVVSLLNALTFTFLGSGGRFAGEPPGRQSITTLMRVPSFWIMAVVFSLGVGSTLGIYTMLPLFLVFEHGYERNLANTFLSLSRLPGIAVVFLAGWARDRFGSRRTLMLVFSIGGAITVLLGLATGNMLLVLIFIQPWVAGCFFPAGFAALSSIGPTSVRSIAVSLTLPFSTLVGGGAFPTLIGFMGDRGSFGSGIAIVGGCILCGALLSWFLKIEGEETGQSDKKP